VLTKEQVRKHWESETAGVRYGEGEDTEGFYQSIEDARYLLEPYIPFFAQFEGYGGKRVLEIGMGGGVDFSRFVRYGAMATGVDLTQGGIAHTLRRLNALSHRERTYYLAQADAENLPFKDNSFDLVLLLGGDAPHPRYREGSCRGVSCVKAGSPFESHDLSYPLLDWLDALDPLCSPGRAALAYTEAMRV